MKIKIHQQFTLTALSLSLLFISSASFALAELNDSDLRQIDGQDGIDISLGFDQADIKQVYWEDNAGNSTATAGQALRLNANNVSFAGYDGQAPNLNLQLNTGSEGTKVGIDAKLLINKFTMGIGGFSICDDTANCDPAGLSKYAVSSELGASKGSLGSLAVQVTSPMQLQLIASNGLFSSTEQGTINLGLNNLNVFLGQRQSLSALTQNQLLTKLNFNIIGKGYMLIDPIKGLTLQTNSSAVSTKADLNTTPNANYGYVDFDRVDDPNKANIPAGQYGTYSATNSGINLELSTVANAADGIYSDTNAKGLIRVGASGRVVNGFLQIRGVSADGIVNPVDNNVTDTHTLNNILGMATTPGSGANASTVVGSSGVGFRMRGEFTSAGDAMLGGEKAGQATALEIGGAGKNSYGFEFSNLSPLVSGSTERAYFDSGDVLVNLANTQSVLLPQNSLLMTSRFEGKAGKSLTTANDYIQTIHDAAVNPYSLVFSIRGMEFQALSKQGRFTSNTGNLTANTFTPKQNEWGLALPIYNMNANLATYATSYTGMTYDLNGDNITTSNVTDSQRIGLSLAMSTQGRNTDGSKTTSIMVIDGGKNSNNGNKPNDYYLGLRNIDMLLSGNGSMGFENGNVNLTMPKLLMVMSAELAAGYLPGAKYKNYNYYSPLNNFQLINDVLLGVKLKVLGDMAFALIPNNDVNDGSKMSVVGEYNLTDGAIQLSDPVDGSMIGLDNLSGRIRFNNSIAIAPIVAQTNPNFNENQQGNVAFNYSFHFNPNHTAQDVFRVRDINFYPPNTAQTTNGQRLGEMVMTGGRLSGSLTLAPRN